MNLSQRIFILSLTCAFVVCGGMLLLALYNSMNSDTPTPTPVPVITTTSTPDPVTEEPVVIPDPVDPFEVYLELAPSDAPELTREDAQTRALLGCGTEWAPGTVDAALAEAYGDLCP